MGGGASSMNMEDLIQTTVMVGRAIAAITFPGMYRIYDFHSPKAPRLKTANHFVLFSDESDDEESRGGNNAIDPSLYDSYMKFVNGASRFYWENTDMLERMASQGAGRMAYCDVYPSNENPGTWVIEAGAPHLPLLMHELIKGAEYYESQYRRRVVESLTKKAKSLGF